MSNPLRFPRPFFGEGPLDRALQCNTGPSLPPPPLVELEEFEAIAPLQDATSPRGLSFRLEPLLPGESPQALWSDSLPQSPQQKALFQHDELERYFAQGQESIQVESLQELLERLELGLTEVPRKPPDPTEGSWLGPYRDFARGLRWRSALQWACALGAHEVGIELFHRLGGGLAQCRDILLGAVEHGCEQAVRLWLDSGIDLELESVTPLLWDSVFASDRESMLLLLMEKGVQLTIRGRHWSPQAGVQAWTENPAMVAALHGAWRCVRVLLTANPGFQQPDKEGYWVMSILARWAPQEIWESFCVAKQADGNRLLGWHVPGGESSTCAWLRRTVGSSALSWQLGEIRMQLAQLERIFRLRGETPDMRVCQVTGESPLEVVLPLILEQEDLAEAVRVCAGSEVKAGALLRWCQRGRESRRDASEKNWWWDGEVLEAWWPQEPAEQVRIAEGPQCAACYAVIHRLHGVLEWMEQRGVDLTLSPRGPLLLALENAEYLWALPRLEGARCDPAELLAGWAWHRLGQPRGERWSLSRTRPSLLELRYSQSEEGQSPEWCCLISLLNAVTKKSRDSATFWVEDEPLQLLVWEAFAIWRAPLASRLLECGHPWDCNRRGVSLWSALLACASPQEREVLRAWRESAPRLARCSRSGLTEGASLLAQVAESKQTMGLVRKELVIECTRRVALEQRTDWERMGLWEREDGQSLLQIAFEGVPRLVPSLLKLGLDGWRRDGKGWWLAKAAAQSDRFGLLLGHSSWKSAEDDQIAELLQEWPERLSASFLRGVQRERPHLLKRLDGAGLDLVGRLLRHEPGEVLRWALSAGVDRMAETDPPTGSQPESLQPQARHPLTQGCPLHLESVALWLQARHERAGQLCPVHQVLPLESALFHQPGRALLLLERLEGLEKGAFWLALAVEAGWAPHELLMLEDTLRRQGALSEEHFASLLARVERPFLKEALFPSPQRAALLTASRRRLLGSADRVRADRVQADRVQADRVQADRVQQDGGSVVLPLRLTRDGPQWEPLTPAAEKRFSRRLLGFSGLLIPRSGTEADSPLTEDSTWMNRCVNGLSGLQEHPAAGRRVAQLFTNSLGPWDSPARSLAEVKGLLLLGQRIALHDPHSVLVHDLLGLTRGWREALHLDEYHRIGLLRFWTRCALRSLAKTCSAAADQWMALGHLSRAGLIPGGSVVSALVPDWGGPLSEAAADRLAAAMAQEVCPLRAARELFEGISSASDSVLRALLAQRAIAIEPLGVDERESCALCMELRQTALQPLLEQGGWPEDFFEDLIWALPLLWELACVAARGNESRLPSSFLPALWLEWRLCHPALHDPLFPSSRLVELLECLIDFAALLEPYSLDWTGLVLSEWLQPSPQLREEERGERLRSALHRVRMRCQVFRATGQLEVRSGTVRLSNPDPSWQQWACGEGEALMQRSDFAASRAGSSCEQ